MVVVEKVGSHLHLIGMEYFLYGMRRRYMEDSRALIRMILHIKALGCPEGCLMVECEVEL